VHSTFPAGESRPRGASTKPSEPNTWVGVKLHVEISRTIQHGHFLVISIFSNKHIGPYISAGLGFSSYGVSPGPLNRMWKINHIGVTSKIRDAYYREVTVILFCFLRGRFMLNVQWVGIFKVVSI
jgi:hypothetical protein